MTDTATTFRKWRIKNKLTQLQVARELGVIGLMNTQVAYQDGEVYVLEVNPRGIFTSTGGIPTTITVTHGDDL